MKENQDSTYSFLSIIESIKDAVIVRNLSG